MSALRSRTGWFTGGSSCAASLSLFNRSELRLADYDGARLQLDAIAAAVQRLTNDAFSERSNVDVVSW